MGAEIRVDLKLATEGIRAQAASAGKTIRDAASGPGAAATPGGAAPGRLLARDWVAQQRALQTGTGGAGGVGLLGTAAAVAMGTVAGLVIAKLINAPFVALRTAVNAVKDAMNRASALYAKQLTSGGLPAGFVAQRAGLSSIMGIGENEVWHFGQAVRYLGDRLKFSSDVMARTNRNVTSASWATRIVGEDFKALGMLLANEVAPTIRRVMTGMHSAITAFGKPATKLLAEITKSIVLPWLTGTIGPGLMLSGKMLGKSLINGGVDPGPVPASSVSSKRLEASPWERMGLVIGQGVGGNPLKATERNTRSAAQTLKDIKAFMSPRAYANPKLAAGLANGA